MKKLSLYFIALVFGAFLFTGCEDRTELTAPPAQSPKSGTADFTRYVALGNSITAGYQSSSLFQGAQFYSYGNLISQQVNTTFAQPLISDPGIGGQLYIKSLTPFVLASRPAQGGSPLNLTYPKPYNNLGVPGALLYDIMNATSSTTCASYLFANTPNPFFDVVLRGQGSAFTQAKLQMPTLVSLWIGNNDVLGFATSGGFAPSAPTASALFNGMYFQLADTLAKTGAKVVVANIPNVTAIPFFTTVGPQVALGVKWYTVKPLGVPGLFYQKHGVTTASTSYADSLGLLTGKVLVTLPASSYSSYFGVATGKWYKDKNYPGIPAGIDTTKPFGFHPQNPLPDALVLDSAEVVTALTATAAYNASILAAATTYNFAHVDINKFFNDVRMKDFSGGSTFGGMTFTTMFVTGGLFSLDGVHPSNHGQAIIANEFIKAINAKWSSSYQMVDIGRVPGGINFGKRLFGQAPVFEYPTWFTYLK